MPLTHFDAEGKARMVDVTEKKETVREATATGKIKVSRDVYDAIEAGTVGKGDVLSVATTAGIMGVKRTANPGSLHGQDHWQDRSGDGGADRCQCGAPDDL